MKITTEDLTTLRLAIEPLDGEATRQWYRDHRDIAVKDINHRYR